MDESVGRMRDDMEALLSEDSSDEDDDNQRQGDFGQEIFSWTAIFTGFPLP